MPKRKCSKKQLEALARGRAMRAAKSKKKTKAAFVGEVDNMIPNKDPLNLIKNKAPIYKVEEPIKYSKIAGKQKLITDLFNAVKLDGVKPNYPLVVWKPPKKEPTQKPITDFFKKEEEKPNYPLAIYKPPQKKKEEKKPGKSAKSIIDDLFGGAAAANKFLDSLKLPEFATSKGEHEFENKLEKIIAEFRKGKNDGPKTKTIMYNGEVIEVPLDLIPDDEAIFAKNSRKYKNALVAAAALGALGYGSAKGIKYFKKYGAPILNSALDIIFTTAKIGGAAAKTTSKAASGIGGLFSTIANGFSSFFNYFRNN